MKTQHGLVFFAFAIIASLWSGMHVKAATIVDIEFRGGGCNMEAGNCVGQFYSLGSDYLVSVNKNFSKIEGSESSGTCAGGHADGSTCSGNGGAGGNGTCSGGGNGGNEESGGSEGSSGSGNPGGDESGGGSHESESVFDRLPPIHMFITLENSGKNELYHFEETILNNTDQYWTGFLMALKMNETGLAMFQHKNDETDLSSNVYDDIYPTEKNQSKKIEWSGGKYTSNNDFALNFEYDILFKDCVGDECSDAASSVGYQIMLQSFPLVPAVPVPEPATVMLFGLGLLGLAGISRRNK